MKFSDGQFTFLWILNFAFVCYLQNSQQLDTREQLACYSIYKVV